MSALSASPWRAGDGNNPFIFSDDGLIIAQVFGNEANANLIVAAPKLLAALTAIESHWSAGNFSRTEELWSQMRAAIAKATGAA